MQVSIETTSALGRRMTIRVPGSQFESEVDNRLQRAARQVRLPGFRPGKVPMKEVRRRFGAGVREEVAGEVMQNSFFEAIRSEDLKPAGRPELEPRSLEADPEFEFTATFEVFPEFDISDLSSVAITRLGAEINDADIDGMIDRLREQRASFVPQEGRAAEDGDEVKLDFTGYRGDEAFEGGSAEDVPLVLGSGRMIPGFEDALLGLKAGDEKSFEITFPEDYGNEDLKGQEARFEVKVHQVAVRQMPELDEKLFEDFGLEEPTLEAFRLEIRSNMERELRNASRTHVKNQVMEALADQHEIMLPHALVHDEIHRLQHDMVRQFGGQGMDPHSLPSELFKDQAERRVKLGLVLNRLIESREVEPDAERVERMLDDIAAPYGEPDQVKAWYHANDEQMAQLRAAATEDQAVDLLLEEMQVTDETSTYDEVLAAAQASPVPDVAEDEADDAPDAEAAAEDEENRA